MCLQDIKKKFKGQYISVHECIADIRLMFSNCYLYNPVRINILKLLNKTRYINYNGIYYLLNAR